MDERNQHIRLGLCCIFKEQPIKFRSTTASALSKLSRARQLEKVSALCLENSHNLLRAVTKVHELDFGAFRVLSPLFPRMTHPDVGYDLQDLADREQILALLKKVYRFREEKKLRMSFHPDQFIVLASPKRDVYDSAVRELNYQAWLSELIGAEIINVHIGGVYGDKEKTLHRFARRYRKLPSAIRARLTVENDDRSYTPADLHPLCMEEGIGLVYDVHHHRCNPDELSIEEATEKSMESWTARKEEPYFHISSPREGWSSKNCRPHADYIDPRDFPKAWEKLDFTLDVEAKAKELAVCHFQACLQHRTKTGSQKQGQVPPG